MISLAIRQLQHRGPRYASLFFAIFASVALSLATAALTTSLVANVNELYGRPYEQADYVVPVSVAEQAEVEATRSVLDEAPGVFAVAWDQRTAVSLREDDGIYAGAVAHSIEPGPLQWREVEQGRLPAGPGELAVTSSPDSPAIGSSVDLRISGKEEDVTATVVGHLEATAQDRLVGGTSVFADPDTIADWATGTIRGEFRVAAAQAPGVTGTVTAAEHVEQLADEYLGQRDRYFLVITAFVLVAAVVAFLVIFSAYSVLTAERRREFGLIRAVGASTAQIVGSVTVESLLLGVLAAGLGAPAGYATAHVLAGQAERFGVRVPIDTITLPGNATWLIVAAGVFMPVLAALPAALSACRNTTVDALRPTALSRTRPGWALLWLVLAVALLAAGWVLAGYVPGVGGQRAVLVAIAAAGAALLGAAVTTAVVLPAVLFSFSRLFGRAPLPTGQLGLAFPGQQKVRSAALIVVLIAGAALSSAVLHGQTRISAHLTDSATRSGGSDLTITALDQPVPADLVDRLRAVPGVAAVAAPETAIVTVAGGRTTPALLLDAPTGAAVMRAGDTGAPAGTIVLGRSSGLQNSLPAGADAEITINDIPLTARVLHGAETATLIDPALVHQARQARADELGVPVEMLPSQPVRTVMVLLEGPSHQPADHPVIAAARAIIDEYPNRYSVTESFSARNSTVDMVGRITTMSSLLAVVALIIAAVGLINTVTLTVTERAALRRLLRAVGLTPGNQAAVLGGELVALSLPSAAVGAVGGGLAGSYVASVVTGASHSRVLTVTHLDLPVVAAVVGAMVVGAVLCGLVVLWLPRVGLHD